MKKSKNWIQKAIKKPGALHRSLHVPVGKKIPPGTLLNAAKKGGKTGARARLAETLKRLHKKTAVKKKGFNLSSGAKHLRLKSKYGEVC